MAAAVVPISAVDLRDPSSYPVRLGRSILQPSESKTYSSVRYNQKPPSSMSADSSCSIRPSKDGSIRLSLRNKDGEYGYEGRTVDGRDRYVLLSRGSGREKEMVLEKLSAMRDFNLTSTSSQKDTGKLMAKYPPIPREDEDEDDLFGEDDEGGDADIDNPFDFRNHLKSEKAKPQPTGADTPLSAASTPRPVNRAATSTPVAQPKRPVTTSAAAQKKRKTQEPLKPNPKRVKAGAEPPAPTTVSTKPQPKPNDVPSVRIDRKASTRRPSLDDSGELILENETPVTERPPKAHGAMALALSGQLGQGPISLRSAASSPASRNASPMPPRPEGIESPAEFELGDSSPETSAKRPPRAQSPGDYFSNAEDEDEDDADADVEDLELPSPRQRRKSVAGDGFGSGGGGAGGGDDDYDMERELELALAQDDGGTAQPSVLHESDEESEEE